MKLTTARIAAFAFVLFWFAHSAQAQKIGLGAQFGQPTGLSLKVYTPRLAYDFLAAWDLNDFFFLNVHGLWERNISGLPNTHYYLGPGAFIGLRDQGRWDNDLVSMGLSGNIGLNVWISRVEIFGQITPRLELIERTNGYIGGGIGFRFYFN